MMFQGLLALHHINLLQIMYCSSQCVLIRSEKGDQSWSKMMHFFFFFFLNVCSLSSVSLMCVLLLLL